MLSHTSADIAAALGRRYSPEGFLSQYSEKSGMGVALGEGAIEERYADFSVVTYSLLVGKQASDSLYMLEVAGFYSGCPEVLSLSFSGKHPMASSSPLIQLTARKIDGHFIRGNDLWLDIVFPGIELLSEQQKLRAQPEPQQKRRIAVATASPLSEAIVRELEELVRDF